MFIDPHVHCRDGKQAYRETISHALSVAERAGFSALFDMPNTDPPVTNKQHVEDRISLAQRANSEVFYGTYLALTPDLAQVRKAVEVIDDVQQVVGFKLYAGHSVGNIGVTDEEKQLEIYKSLAEIGYSGVIVVHCEKEALLKPNIWNPNEPVTHALARPPEAEIESVKDQLRLAKRAGFRGRLHVAHVSTPEAAEIIASESELEVSCGVCPHHLLFDYSAMQGPNGILLKMNPPLRSLEMKKQLLELLKQGKIDLVETDHAPHTLEEKTNPPYLSGIPGLQIFPRFVQWLHAQGLPEKQIQDLTFNRAKQIFRIDFLQKRECVPEEDLAGEYSFNPYAGVL